MNDKLRTFMQEARKAAKMKQKDVAEILGLRGSTISNWENGVSDPDIDEFVSLCEIYGINFSAALVAAYGDPTKNESPIELSWDEHELIKKYRALDERGKRAVNKLIDVEHDFCA